MEAISKDSGYNPVVKPRRCKTASSAPARTPAPTRTVWSDVLISILVSRPRSMPMPGWVGIPQPPTTPLRPPTGVTDVLAACVRPNDRRKLLRRPGPHDGIPGKARRIPTVALERQRPPIADRSAVVGRTATNLAPTTEATSSSSASAYAHSRSKPALQSARSCG